MISGEKFAFFVPRLSEQDGMGYAAFLSISAVKLLGKNFRVFCYDFDKAEPNLIRIPTAIDLISFPQWTNIMNPPLNIRQLFSFIFQYVHSGDLLASPLHALVSTRLLDILRTSDVIYYHLGSFDTFGPAAFYSKIQNRSKLIVEYHGLPPPCYINGIIAKLGQKSALGLSRQLIERSDIIIVHSKFSYRECLSYFGVTPTHILPLGIDLTKFKRRREREEAKLSLGLGGKIVLLYVGRLVNYKRVDFLIKAVNELRKTFPNIILVIIGIGNATKYIHLAYKMGIQNNVLILGPVEDTVPYFEAADLFVTASLHEGFCLPVVEAQSLGIPVVAPRIGALPETVSDGGFLFEPFDLNDLVDKVCRVLQDSNLYKRLQRVCLIRSFSYDKYITIQRLSEIISSII
jgi:glycosyltransferase involved in cell wall biosynthesis